MKKMSIGLIVCFSFFLLCTSSAAEKEKTPSPFGFVVDKTTYQDALDILASKNWAYREFEKKQFKEIGKQSAEKGKNTFLVVKLKKRRRIEHFLIHVILAKHEIKEVLIERRWKHFDK